MVSIAFLVPAAILPVTPPGSGGPLGPVLQRPMTQLEPGGAAPRTPVPTPSAVCAHTPAGVRHIYVNIASQTLSACTGPVLFTHTLVTTGAWKLTNVNNATPIGTWRIYSKVRNTVLSGHDVNGSWRDPVKYWMAFNLGYGFHDASWQKFPFGSPLYKTKGSHGCVHLPPGEMAIVYNWARIGTLVTITRR